MADRFDSGGVESLQHVERQGGKEEEGGWSAGKLAAGHPSMLVFLHTTKKLCLC